MGQCLQRVLLSACLLAFVDVRAHAEQMPVDYAKKPYSSVDNLLSQVLAGTGTDSRTAYRKYALSYDLYTRLHERGLNPFDPVHRKDIASDIFSVESYDTLKRAIGRFAAPQCPHIAPYGLPGVGKSHLVDQFVAMYSLGILPNDLRQQLNLDVPESPTRIIENAFFAKTDVYRLDMALLSKPINPNSRIQLNTEGRINEALQAFFDAAREQFRVTKRRVIFVFDEAHQIPEYLFPPLLELMAEGGFNPDPSSSSVRQKDPGFHVALMSNTIQKISKGDPAIERRFLALPIREISDASALKVGIANAKRTGRPFEISVDDNAVAFLVKMKKFLATPPRAAPGIIIDAVDEMISWKMLEYRGEGDPHRITLQDARKFFIMKSGLTEIWLEGPNGEPPFHNLEQELKKLVKGQDRVLEEIAEVLKRWVRFQLGKTVPILVLGGVTGSGKNEILRALNKVLYGHDGTNFVFSLGGKTGIEISAIKDGPPKGTHSDDQPSLFVERLRSNPPGIYALDEVNDAPTSEIDRWKEMFDEGILRSAGLDAREIPLLHPLMIMGQFGEHLFDGKNAYEMQVIYDQVMDDPESLEDAFTHGKKGDPTIGVLTEAIRGRAKVSGAILLLRPHIPENFPPIAELFADKAIQDLKDQFDLLIDQSVLDVAGALTSDNSKTGARELKGIFSSLVFGAMSKAMDDPRDGLREGTSVIVRSIAVNGIMMIRIEDADNQDRGWNFDIKQLRRTKRTCTESFLTGVYPRLKRKP